jgi:hypothetical protein
VACLLNARSPCSRPTRWRSCWRRERRQGGARWWWRAPARQGLHTGQGGGGRGSPERHNSGAKTVLQREKWRLGGGLHRVTATALAPNPGERVALRRWPWTRGRGEGGGAHRTSEEENEEGGRKGGAGRGGTHFNGVGSMEQRRGGMGRPCSGEG